MSTRISWLGRAACAVVVCVSLVSAASGGPAGSQGGYEIIDLGTLLHSSWAWSAADAINNNGGIVGYGARSYSIYLISTAARFDSSGAGNNTDLVRNVGILDSFANAISDAGDVVGEIQLDSTPRGYEAITMTDTGPSYFVRLGTLGGRESEALSVNNHGQPVGWAHDSSGNVHAALFDPSGNGTNVDLGTVGGKSYRVANDINDSQQIVGYVSNDKWSGGERAVLFDPTGDGNNLDLGTIGGFGTRSKAFAVNNTGQAVGWANYSTNHNLIHATMFDLSGNGQNVDLGTLGGNSEATRITDNGKILGYARTPFGDEHPTIFDSSGSGNNVDIQHSIPAASHWQINQVTDINNDGWLVGTGSHQTDYADHAILMKPSSPATTKLLMTFTSTTYAYARAEGNAEAGPPLVDEHDNTDLQSNANARAQADAYADMANASTDTTIEVYSHDGSCVDAFVTINMHAGRDEYTYAESSGHAILDGAVTIGQPGTLPTGSPVTLRADWTGGDYLKIFRGDNEIGLMSGSLAWIDIYLPMFEFTHHLPSDAVPPYPDPLTEELLQYFGSADNLFDAIIFGEFAYSSGGDTPLALTAYAGEDLGIQWYCEGNFSGDYYEYNFYLSDTFGLTLSATPVPEPATLSLLAVGGVALMRRRRKA